MDDKQTARERALIASALVASAMPLHRTLMIPRLLPKPKPTKPGRPCLLPGCGLLTVHNGGYCCAEHCLEHRRMRRMEQPV